MSYALSIADLRAARICYLDKRVAALQDHLGRAVPDDEALPMAAWAEITPDTRDLIYALRLRPDGRHISVDVARRAADRAAEHAETARALRATANDNNIKAILSAKSEAGFAARDAVAAWKAARDAARAGADACAAWTAANAAGAAARLAASAAWSVAWATVWPAVWPPPQGTEERAEACGLAAAKAEWSAIRADLIARCDAADGGVRGHTAAPATALVPAADPGWIGPIPAIPVEPGTVAVFSCGDLATTRPAWGGYLPCRQPDGRWGADGTATVLRHDDHGWWVQRPQHTTRLRRAVVIAADALRDGAPIPSGITAEEEAQARSLVDAGTPAWRWAAADAWGRADEERTPTLAETWRHP